MSSTIAPATEHPRSVRDRLTGALSRMHFLSLLRDEKVSADRHDRPFQLCLIDVDQLRNVNDEAGQRAGDEVLIGIVNRARDILDTPPWIDLNYLHARYDGDGLMILLRSGHIEHAARFAEALRQRVAQSIFGQQRVTVSIGIAAYHVGESLDELLARTERTLYLAKQSGRDCIEIAYAPPVPARDNVVYLEHTRPNGPRSAGNF